MKPKRITPEQYVTLAALEMPVYSCTSAFSKEQEHILMGCLKNDIPQRRERLYAESFSKEYDVFYTLVDSDET